MSSCPDTRGAAKQCPFCKQSFLRLGTHLPHCRERKGASYEHLLSEKTLKKRAVGNVAKKKCPRCGKSFKRLDAHLARSSKCKEAAVVTVNPVAPPLPPEQPLQEEHVEPLPQFPTPPPDSREILLLPKTNEDWMKADAHLAAALPGRLGKCGGDIERINKVICEEIYQYFALHHGTRTPRVNRNKKPRHHPHNRELKRLRKAKTAAMRALRQAQRERKSTDMLRTLKRDYLKATRSYSKALKRSKKKGERHNAARMRKECAESFWKFASKVLDSNDTSDIRPALSIKKAENFFTSTYSSDSYTFSQPDWLPTPADPTDQFDSDPIRIDEVIAVIKRSKASSSPSPYDAISYRVLKRCPSLSKHLLDLYNLCWETSAVPSSWKQASITLIAKTSAKDDPSNPANFRPIALTSSIGKVYTTIIKDRWLSFMQSNHYFDTSTQKAFMPSVPGCVEHYAKLSAAIGEAHKYHKSLCVCWLDLANAYGSVHHGLINFSLNHYHAPPKLTSMVHNFYSDLRASVLTPDGPTQSIPLQIGLYQGDPLSTTIFNTVMNTYLDGLKHLQVCGYKFSNSNKSLQVLQYADDTCLVSDGPASCRRMLSFTDRWLQWSRMRAKVSKCQCVAIEASSGKVYNPQLTIAGGEIPFIGNQPVRFLGGTVQVPQDQALAREKITSKLTSLLSIVDNVPVTRKQKIKLYRLGICPRLSWDLTISEYPVSWLEKTLDPIVTRYLKRWSGLTKSADPARLFLPQTEGGFHLSPPSTQYQKLQVGKASLLITSRDNTVNHVVHQRIEKEKAQQRAKFQPFTAAQTAFTLDPGASGKAVSKRAKEAIEKEIQGRRLQHSRSLKVQGKLFRCSGPNAAAVWVEAVQSLPPAQLKFALNAASDSLPHNANLALWKKTEQISSACKLCGGRQTLCHILNNCEVALQLRRYNSRHDEVLSVISDFVTKQMPDETTIVTDLSDNYQFPPCLALTDLRPDLVTYDAQTKSVLLLELTVCFETNFEDARKRKEDKYSELVEEVERNGFDVELITIEVGSRGMVNYDSFHRLRDAVGASNKELRHTLLDISRAAIRGSFAIWINRNHRNPPDP